MITLKTWGPIGALIAGALLWRRSAPAAGGGEDPNGLASLCVSGTTGATACGGDATGPWSVVSDFGTWLKGLGAAGTTGATPTSGYQLSTVTKGAERVPGAWTDDPQR